MAHTNWPTARFTFYLSCETASKVYFSIFGRGFKVNICKLTRGPGSFYSLRTVNHGDVRNFGRLVRMLTAATQWSSLWPPTGQREGERVHRILLNLFVETNFHRA